jgi:hypothetical protein
VRFPFDDRLHALQMSIRQLTWLSLHRCVPRYRKRYHHDSYNQLRQHSQDFSATYSLARRLKTPQ